MDWYNFQMQLSDKPERCDKCKKMQMYSPGAPGYIYTDGAKQYCPACMTEINDAQRLSKEESASRKKRRQKEAKMWPFNLF